MGTRFVYFNLQYDIPVCVSKECGTNGSLVCDETSIKDTNA